MGRGLHTAVRGLCPGSIWTCGQLINSRSPLIVIARLPGPGPQGLLLESPRPLQAGGQVVPRIPTVLDAKALLCGSADHIHPVPSATSLILRCILCRAGLLGGAGRGLAIGDRLGVPPQAAAVSGRVWELQACQRGDPQPPFLSGGGCRGLGVRQTGFQSRLCHFLPLEPWSPGDQVLPFSSEPF